MPVSSDLAAHPQVEASHAQQPYARIAFFLIAGALGTVSISLAAYVASQRGVDLPSKVAWGTVGAALALGLLLAPAEAAAFVRRRQWGAAFAATLLALTCASFVLTGALGNVSAGRVAASRTATGTAEHRSRLAHEYEKAKAELAELPAARLAGEIEPEIGSLNAIIGRAHCDEWVRSRHVRNSCAQRSPLLAELARSRRRADLERTMADAHAALNAPIDQRPAGEDARILAKYLRALGLNVSTDRMSDALIIIAVLSLELGGALALILARAQAVQSAGASSVQPVQPPPARARRPAHSEQHNERAERSAPSSSNAQRSANVVPLRPSSRTVERAQLEHAMAGIIEHAERGSLPSAQRAMARLLNVSVGTISAALAEIESSGIAIVQAGPSGTKVRIKLQDSA